MSKKDKNPCYECNKSISGNKAFECHDCGEVFCKEHIKLTESEHSSHCYSCFRKKVHLEVTLEMEPLTIEAQNVLSGFKEKLKNCKKDLLNKKSNIERHSNQIKINEKTYIRKFESLEKKIEDETKRADNLNATIQAFKATLDDSKAAEIVSKAQMETVEDCFNSTLFEMELLKQENNKLRNDLSAVENKAKKIIQYSRLRNTICANCKNKVKIAFQKEIIAGNKDRSSLIESVLAEKEKFQVKKQEKQEMGIESNAKKEDKACCCSF